MHEEDQYASAPERGYVDPEGDALAWAVTGKRKQNMRYQDTQDRHGSKDVEIGADTFARHALDRSAF
jgi:hypothetical protein